MQHASAVTRARSRKAENNEYSGAYNRSNKLTDKPSGTLLQPFVAEGAQSHCLVSQALDGSVS